MSLVSEQLIYEKYGHKILDLINVTVRPNQWTALIGPNGAGKSTLIHLLGGASCPTDGQVLLNDLPIEHYTIKEKSRILSVLPQEVHLEFPLSAKEVLELGLLNKLQSSSSRIAIDDLLRILKIEHLLDRNYLSLSGGERQRIHIARVCSQLTAPSIPSYLLLDEPFAPLDLAHQKILIGLIKDLCRQSVGVLTSLHDLNLCWFADSVIILKEGSIIIQAQPNNALTIENLKNTFDVNLKLLCSETNKWIAFDLN